MKKRRAVIYVSAVILLTAGLLAGCALYQGTENGANKENDIPASWRDGGIFSGVYETAYQKLRTMSLEEKVGQMILARRPQNNSLSAVTQYHLGGFVLFGDDFKGKTEDEVIREITSAQSASAIPMVMAVDEEGGTVVRISSNPQLSARKFQSPQQVYARGGLAAIRADAVQKADLLKKLGLNLNLAPVADVSTDPADFMYERALGQPAQPTADYVAAVVETMKDAGLSSALKHFPGYGNNRDTHTGIAVDKRPYSTFTGSDFIPFQAGIDAGAECVLVAHTMVECMDPGVPASLSPPVHQALRDKLHFTGVILTDDLSMGGVKDYAAKANVSADPYVDAVLAGNDMLLMTDFAAGWHSILTAAQNGQIAPELIDRAVFRILAWKYAKGMQ